MFSRIVVRPARHRQPSEFNPQKLDGKILAAR
jgi:hypothetical protein